MKSIPKRPDGGRELTRAHAERPSTPEQATRRWDNFAYKPRVLEFLLHEQYGLCCYSEIRSDEEGLGYHIEHVENKSQAPERTFDFQNLGASAISSERLRVLPRTECFGGHAVGKANAVDMALFVCCHSANCSEYFFYLSDGRVVAADGLSPEEEFKANYTIELLNLNSAFLINRRRSWWDELSELFEEHQARGWDIRHLAVIDLVPRGYPVPVLSRFFSLTRQFYGPVVEGVLEDTH